LLGFPIHPVGREPVPWISGSRNKTFCRQYLTLGGQDCRDLYRSRRDVWPTPRLSRKVRTQARLSCIPVLRGRDPIGIGHPGFGNQRARQCLLLSRSQLFLTKRLGPRTRVFGPGTRELFSAAVLDNFPGTQDSAGPRGLAETRDPGLDTLGQVPGTRDPGPRLSSLGPGPRLSSLGLGSWDPAGPPGLAGTRVSVSGMLGQAPGTRDPGPGTSVLGPGNPGPGTSVLGPGYWDPAGPPGLAGTRESGPDILCQAPGTRDPGPGTSVLGPGPGTSVLGPGTQYLVSSRELSETRESANQPGLAGTRDPGPGMLSQAPGIRDPGPGPSGLDPGNRYSAGSRERVETREAGPGIQCLAPVTRDPGLIPSGMITGPRDPAGPTGLTGTRDSGPGTQCQAPRTRYPGPGLLGPGSGTRVPTDLQGSVGTQALVFRNQDQGPVSQDSARQAGFPGTGQMPTYPPGFNPMGWSGNLAGMAQAFPAPPSATQSAPGPSAAQGCPSGPKGPLAPQWPGQIPYPWGPFGHMGWFPPGFSSLNPAITTSQNAQERFVTPRGVSDQGQGAEVFRHYSPLTQPAHRPLPASSQVRPDESPMELTSGSSCADEDSSTDDADQVPHPWVAPSGTTTHGPSVTDPDFQDQHTEDQRQVNTPECSTYEETLTNVKSFLASSRDPQGYPINMRAPQGTQRRRLTSLLAGPPEPVRQEGLPWTPDIRTSLYRLNLSLRGVPKGQQRRFEREDLPLPPPDLSVMGRGVFPGKFAESASSAHFRSFPNQLQGMPESVDISLQPPDIPHRLWAAHPQPPSHVNLTWKAAADTEGLVRQQASMLSHVSWWNYALQLRLRSLSDSLAEREPALAQASREAASWAEAGLTAATKALDTNQTLMAQFLLLRRDAVLSQTKLSANRANQLRAAPLESTDLLGPDFDQLASTWSLEDEQAKTLGGKAARVSGQPARAGKGRQKQRPFVPQVASQQQSRKRKATSSSTAQQGTQPRTKPKKKKNKGSSNPSSQQQRGNQKPFKPRR